MYAIVAVTFVIFNSFPNVYSSYCGQAAIPYSFQVLSDGQLLLGCARPSCFGWNANGEVAGDSAKFSRVHKRNDGYLRDGDSEKKNFAKYDFYKIQTSVCEPGFSSSSCNKPKQWVGGIAPTSHFDQFRLKCCTYDGLQLATDRGSGEVGNGQIMIGGEVSSKKRQYAFDYIANIQKIIHDDGIVTYNVTMKRFPCLSPLVEPKIEVEERVFSFVNSMSGWPKNKSHDHNTAAKKKELTKGKETGKAQKTTKQKMNNEMPKSENDDKSDSDKSEDEKILKLLESERAEQTDNENKPMQLELPDIDLQVDNSKGKNTGEVKQQTGPAVPGGSATGPSNNYNPGQPQQSIASQSQLRPAQGPHIPPPLGVPEQPQPPAPKLNGIPSPNLLQPQQPQLLQQQQPQILQPQPMFNLNLPTLNAPLALPTFQQPTYQQYVLQQPQPLQQQSSFPQPQQQPTIQQLQPQPQPQLNVAKQPQPQPQPYLTQDQRYQQNAQTATVKPPVFTLPTLPPLNGMMPLLPWGR